MDIYLKAFAANSYHFINNEIFKQLTPLQKKVAVLVVAYFTLVIVSCFLYRYCCFNNPTSLDEIDDLEDTVLKSPKTKILRKSGEAQPKIIVRPLLPTTKPGDTLEIKEAEKIEGVEEDTDSKLNRKEKAEPGTIDEFITMAEAKEDFLSILRCMVDHPEWVCENMEQTVSLLSNFGNQVRFLQPIKVVADHFEILLKTHSFLIFDVAKNTNVVFENKSKYRTHLIFALKNIHAIRDLLEDEMTEVPLLNGEAEIQLPGDSKALKAVFQYLDMSSPSEIDKANFYQLIKLASQYSSPSLWRYCEANIKRHIPTFPHDANGVREWTKTLQQYAVMNTNNVNFILDYLLRQKQDDFVTLKEYSQFLNDISLPDHLSKSIQDSIKANLNDRLKIVTSKIEAIREEHEDRIESSVDTLQKLAVRLGQGIDSIFDYLSCSSINQALSTLFRAAIAKQFTKDTSTKKCLIDALRTIYKHQNDLIDQNKWRKFEWNDFESQSIHSLATSLLNYLVDDVPDKIKTHPGWHQESLVLAFNDNDGEVPLYFTVVNFAANAVSTPDGIGFFYLFRPSSRVASSKDSIIFTMTANSKNSMYKRDVKHCRIEAIQNKEDDEWVFKVADSEEEPLPLDVFIHLQARGLKRKRILTYIGKGTSLK